MEPPVQKQNQKQKNEYKQQRISKTIAIKKMLEIKIHKFLSKSFCVGWCTTHAIPIEMNYKNTKDAVQWIYIEHQNMFNERTILKHQFVI